MTETSDVRYLRIYVDIPSGKLRWSEYNGDLTGDLVGSGLYESDLSLEVLYAAALADPSLVVDESEWWNGDCIAASGAAGHELVRAAARDAP